MKLGGEFYSITLNHKKPANSNITWNDFSMSYHAIISIRNPKPEVDDTNRIQG